MNGPLAGIRVLALSHFIAGPFGSMLLGDMGAEIIKIEPPEPTANRTLAGPGHKGESFYHLAFNRSKKSVTIDLRTRTGYRAFLDLVRIADVVWTNFRPGAVENIRADYDTVKEINPEIIYGQVSGYGLSGPYRDRPSFDIGGLAMSGVMSLTGEPGGPPLKPGAPIGDIMCGTLGALGVVAALHQRERTGKGQLVDISLLDSCMSTLLYEYSHYFSSGIVPGPTGSGHLSLIPYNAYQTATGWIVIGPSWPRLARVLDMEWMIDDPRFTTQAARLEHREEFEQLVRNKLKELPAEDWLELMYLEDIPAVPVNTLDEVVADPQVQHRNMVLEMEHPLGGAMKMVGNPLKMPGCIDDTVYPAPPVLGQHNDEILGKLLGYSRRKIDRLLAEGRANIAVLSEHLHKRL